MTNGEIIQNVFTCEVCEPIPEDDIIHVIFSDKSDSAIGFDLSWWNMEYKEPTTKNNLSVDCVSRKEVFETIDDCNRDGLKGIFCSYDDGERFKEYIKNLPPVTPQEPKIVPIAEIKYDEDKLKELVNKAVLTVTSQEPILDKINKMKSEIADSLEFWDYSPNNNPLARDMLETLTNFLGDLRGEGE